MKLATWPRFNFNLAESERAALSAKSNRHADIFVDWDANDLNDDLRWQSARQGSCDCRNSSRQPVDDVIIARSLCSKMGIIDYPFQSSGIAAETPPVCDIDMGKRRDVPERGRLSIAYAWFTSLAVHLALLAALSVSLTAPIVQEEAGSVVSLITVGDSETNRTVAGDPDLQVDPLHQEDVPANTQSAAVQPNAMPAIEDRKSQFEQEAALGSSMPDAAEPLPLTSNAPAETAALQAVATQGQEDPKPVAPVEMGEGQKEQSSSMNAPGSMPASKIVHPIEKLKATVKKKSKNKTTKKPPGSQSGKRGDSGHGEDNDSKAVSSDQSSRSAARSDGMGNADIDNYPGKVQSRIRRAVRYPLGNRRMLASMNVRVRLTISRDGSLAEVSVVQSSGIPALDSAVVAGVRRAAPYPPLPSKWSKPSWTFAQDVQVTGR
ncbi:protein TonB [Phyllobacterium myrsinacearum]|uniref:energy transducer TonB n=1 Tax=Phyllobacterium myrsinacearum TaxID=28101 RepID=UPI00102A29C2|nr:TonB family protein [Phyllobacterium myrsinacearum]RZS79798.1 protein TonB [Phyllobacterium myrsinacearum]